VTRLLRLPDLLLVFAPAMFASGLALTPIPGLAADGAPGKPADGAADSAAASAARCGWPAWQAFQAHLLQADGRVIDPASARAHTVSEAQAYALFFALVQGDRAVFERILRWTEDNLAGGDLALRLPAWQWGRRDDGSYGVLDDNSAADADLWLAYVLGEAGGRWNERRYRALSSLLAERILREETAIVPGLGRMLLPGAQGFAPVRGRWTFNPSYAPPFLLRWFAVHSGDPRWEDVRRGALRMLSESAPAGFAPDWAYYNDATAADGKSAAGAVAGNNAGDHYALETLSPAERTGGYDAIRVYLWLGMTAAADPDRAALLQHFSPMARAADAAGAPPVAVDAAGNAAPGSDGPPGFSAALLPLLGALESPDPLRKQLARLAQHPPAADAYYDQALTMFGRGWHEGWFAFAADGSVVLPARCPSAAGQP
jgi:endoglucanase